MQAEGSRLWDAEGTCYLDAIGGISVASIGHRHPRVVEAIRAQTDAYLHVMVYGETVQTPQAEFAAALTAHLPPSLDCVYFVASGAEATDGALKLARRATGLPETVACHYSYHGSSSGALSLMGDAGYRTPYAPLTPGVRHTHYNGEDTLSAITTRTAAVVLETVQAEAGVVLPDPVWLRAVRNRCTETGALLILDEIQCGLGRTGTLWAFEQYGIVPDILLTAKALGGGMPMGAFISSVARMELFSHGPALGHITTFGGHPVCCAAGLAGFNALLDEGHIGTVREKEAVLHAELQHPAIREVRTAGLLAAVQLHNPEAVQGVLERCLERGVFADWFLFQPGAIRLAPPLNISTPDLQTICRTVVSSM